jgi:flagellar basal body-associated protein FliL
LWRDIYILPIIIGVVILLALIAIVIVLIVRRKRSYSPTKESHQVTNDFVLEEY